MYQKLEQEITSQASACSNKTTYKSVKSLFALLVAAIMLLSSMQASIFTAFAVGPPAAPLNVKAASASYNSIKVSWSVVKSATGYVVYRYNTVKKTYEKLAAAKTTSYANTGLLTGKTYSFKARAYTSVSGKNIYGTYSTAVSAKPIPSAPLNLKAASLSYKSVKLSWSAVSGASGYVVYRYNSVKKAYERLKVTKAAGFTNDGLTTGKTYSFKVQAYRTVSGKNIYSKSSVTATAKPIPAVPGAFKAASASSTSIKVTWGAVSEATGYVLYRYNSAKKVYEKLIVTSGTSFTDARLKSGTSYSYKVRAYRTVGKANVYGILSASASAKPSVLTTTTTMPVTTTKPVTTTVANTTTKPNTTTTIPNVTTTKPNATTTKPNTTTTTQANIPGGELSKILNSSKYTLTYDINVVTGGSTTTQTGTVYASGNKLAFDTTIDYQGKPSQIRLISTGTEYFVIFRDLYAYGKLSSAEKFNNLYPNIDLVNYYDSDAKFLGTTNVTYGGVSYVCESFSKSGSTTKYFFKDAKLKRIEITDKSGSVSKMENVVFSASVSDDSMFSVPVGYQNITLLVSALF